MRKAKVTVETAKNADANEGENETTLLDQSNAVAAADRPVVIKTEVVKQEVVKREVDEQGTEHTPNIKADPVEDNTVFEPDGDVLMKGAEPFLKKEDS